MSYVRWFGRNPNHISAYKCNATHFRAHDTLEGTIKRGLVAFGGEHALFKSLEGEENREVVRCH